MSTISVLAVLSLAPSLVSFNHDQKPVFNTFVSKRATGTHEPNQEPMTRSLQLPYWAYVTAFLQTDLFLDYLFRKKTKAVPVR